jgi:hypothetical protein
MNRIIYYYQTFIGLNDIINKNIITHIHLSSIHFRKNEKGIKSIYLNDSVPSDKMFDPVWEECYHASQKGIKIILMVGGAGGAYTDLFSSFETYYNLLKDCIKSHDFISGVDLDIEEEVNLADVKMLIHLLKDDFGNDFIISMAPLGDSLMNDTPGMGGFVYKELYQSEEGMMIDYFNGQFYDSFTFNAYDLAIQNGYPHEKVVLGMVSSQFTAETFMIALNEVKKIKEKYPNFAGVFNWEYFDSPPDKKNPQTWAIEMKKVLCDDSYKNLCLIQ